MNNPEWISVKERLPEQEGRCLILYRHKDFGPLIEALKKRFDDWYERWQSIK